MEISKDREYVLVSIKWTGDGHLIFWGNKTDDNESRSYSGYTMNLDTCERYKRDEIREEYHPIWNGERLGELLDKDPNGTWAVKVNDLEKIGQKKTIIWV